MRKKGNLIIFKTSNQRKKEIKPLKIDNANMQKQKSILIISLYHYFFLNYHIETKLKSL